MKAYITNLKGDIVARLEGTKAEVDASADCYIEPYWDCYRLVYEEDEK